MNQYDKKMECIESMGNNLNSASALLKSVSESDTNDIDILTIIFPEVDPFIQRSHAFKNIAHHHALHDYLILCSHIALAQSQTLDYFMHDVSVNYKDQSLPLVKDHPNECIPILKVLLNQLLKNKSLNLAAKDTVNVLVRHALNQRDYDFLSQEAECLMALDLEKITLEFSPFIGAALQILYTMKAHRFGITRTIPKNFKVEKDACPCCGMPPIASIIDPKYGQLRYLNCSVCDTRWYLDHQECHECDEGSNIERVALQNGHFSIKAESCHACMSYLKWLDLGKNPLANVFVEDLISRDLDAALLAEDYMCASQNFYMLTKTE